MSDAKVIPALSIHDKHKGLQKAAASDRHRHPKILHAPGADFNEVFNFMMRDSYMQPHLHPGTEKIEEIHLVEGRIGVLYFDDDGRVTTVSILEKGGIELIEVPAFTWHTYVIQSAHAITYETMMGKYDVTTWKSLADWAPTENSSNALQYLDSIRQRAFTEG